MNENEITAHDKQQVEKFAYHIDMTLSKHREKWREAKWKYAASPVICSNHKYFMTLALFKN